MNQYKSKVEIIVQDSYEQGNQYSERLNKILEDINKQYPTAIPFTSQTASSNGRLTTMISWGYWEPDTKKKDNQRTMLVALDISKRLSDIIMFKSADQASECTNIIAEEINKFIES